MVFIINSANWCNAIGEAIRQSSDGDVIVVDSAMKVRLVEKAVKAQCPCKKLVIQVGDVTRKAIA